MFTKWKVLFLIFIMFVSTALAFAEKNDPESSEKVQNGYELCDQVYNTLKKKGFSLESQALISSGTNIFPYNILIEIPSIEETSENLVIIFPMESFPKSQDLIFNTITTLKNSNFPFNITLLISYGDNQIPAKNLMLRGTQFYIDTLPSSNNIYAILINTEAEENSITNTSEKNNTPSWMIKNAYKVYNDNHLPNTLPALYISQIHKYNIIRNSVLELLLDSGIQAIQFDLNYKAEQKDLYSKILTDYISLYKTTSSKEWDQHCLLVKVFNKSIWISEVILVKLIILFSFFIILAFSYYIFSHKNTKKRIWKLLKHVWHIPFFLILQILLFYQTGSILSQYISSFLNDNSRLYFLFLIQITLFFVITITFFKNNLYVNSHYKENAIDFEILCINFLNLLLFSLFDITLYPMFLCNFAIAFLNKYITKKTSGIFVLFLSILIYIPYLNSFFQYIDIIKVQNILIHSWFFILSISFVITPIFLQVLRILSYSYRKKFNIYITIIIVYICLISCLSFFSIKYKNNFEKHTKTNNIFVYNDFQKFNTSKSLIKISYSDEYIFSDTIRTLKINFSEQPVQCTVELTGNKVPVLYSDNDFISTSDTSSEFIIPYYPPQNMTFNYGTDTEDSLITVTAIFPLERENCYYTQKESIKIHN